MDCGEDEASSERDAQCRGRVCIARLGGSRGEEEVGAQGLAGMPWVSENDAVGVAITGDADVSGVSENDLPGVSSVGGLAAFGLTAGYDE